MPRPLFALLLVVAALLQATILPALGPLVVMPNLVLVLVLARAAMRNLAEALLWTAFAGFLLDVLAMDPIGLNGLALLPVAVTGVVSQRRFFQSGVLFPMLLTMIATGLNAVALAGLRALFSGGLEPMVVAPRMVVLQALLNAVLVPPVYGLMRWLNRAEYERG